MKYFRADLHIHSCLSPCADLDMSPKKIIENSLEKGLDFIAISDHNSAKNAGALIKAGASKGFIVLPGIEINSLEEIHLLSIFDKENQALFMQDFLYCHLEGENRPKYFGEQVIANEFDEVEGFEDKMLINATDLRLDDIIKEVHKLGGICIASHIDRPSYSILSQLGFIPPNIEFDALEYSPNSTIDEVKNLVPDNEKWSFTTFSDAHFLKDIGKRSTGFFMESPCIEEIRLALKGKDGRKVVIN